MHRLLLFIPVIFVCFLLVPSPALAAKRVALAIGINDYPKLKTSDDPSSGQLRKAVADAETIGAALIALGFEVEIARNVDRIGFLTALERLKRRIAPGDTVFIFYAGHGITFGGSNLLLPSDIPPVDPDAEQLVRHLSIAETDIIEGLREKGAGLVVLTLDACRNNPIEELQRKQARLQGRAFRNTGTMRSIGILPRGSTGVFSIYSAGLGQRALDSLSDTETDRNSVFTRVFARRLQERGRHLADIILDVRQDVAALARTVIDPETRQAHSQFPAYYDETQGGRIFLGGEEPVDPDAAVRRDYETAQRANTVAAWDAFLVRHPTGNYADLARVQRGKLASLPAQVPPTTNPLSCTEERTARSIDANQPTAMQFKNNRSSAVRIYWLDYQGQRKFYTELAPGQEYVQPTFVTHPWIVTDQTERCLAFYMPDRSQRRVDIR